MLKKSRFSTIMIHAVFISICLLCLLPMILVLSVSFSDEMELIRSGYRLIPKKFSLMAYQYIFADGKALINAYGVTLFVSFVGSAISLVLITMTSYTLSRQDFKYRRILSFFIYFTVLFGGGMIPKYILVTRYLKIGDTIWALFLPILIVQWFVFLMRRFISDIPMSVIESAKIDGAGEYRTLFDIVMPMSKPALAAIGLFLILGYWNNWWLSLLYIEKPELVSLQYLLYRIAANVQALSDASEVGFTSTENVMLPDLSMRMAMCILAAGPMLFAFSFFQKYFVQGLNAGAVKG